MSAPRASLSSRLLLGALRVGVALARVLPPRLVIDLCAAGGRSAGRVSGKRRWVRENLRAVAPSRPPADLSAASPAASSAGPRRTRVLDVFAAYGRYWGEFLVLAARPRWFDARLRRVEGEEHLRGAAAAGPVCAVTGHLGNWDLCARFTRRYLAGLSVVAEPLRPEPLFRFFCRVRRRDGGEIIAAPGGGRKLYLRWKRGEHVGLVADRVFGAGSREASFLGGRRSFPSAGMHLARRAGAAIVPVFLVREGGGYVLRAHPAVAVSEEPVEAFARALEVEVRRHADQWCLLAPAFDPPAGARDRGELGAGDTIDEPGAGRSRATLRIPCAAGATSDRGAFRGADGGGRS